MSACDRLGYPLIELADGTLIHALPLTVYHFERYVWTRERGGLVEEWERVLSRERPGFRRIVEGHEGEVLLTGITVARALQVAAWLGGRLPTVDELREAHGAVSRGPVRELVAEGAGTDVRVREFVNAVRDSGHRTAPSFLPPVFAEFATQNRTPPHTSVSLVCGGQEPGYVNPNGLASYSDPTVGFRCVFERSER